MQEETNNTKLSRAWPAETGRLRYRACRVCLALHPNERLLVRIIKSRWEGLFLFYVYLIFWLFMRIAKGDHPGCWVCSKNIFQKIRETE